MVGIGCKRVLAWKRKGKCFTKGKVTRFLPCLQDLIITQRCQLYLFYGPNICVLQCNWDFRFNMEELCLLFHPLKLFPCLC